MPIGYPIAGRDCFVYLAARRDGEIYIGYSRDPQAGMRTMAARSRENPQETLLVSWQMSDRHAASGVAKILWQIPKVRLRELAGSPELDLDKLKSIPLAKGRVITCSTCGQLTLSFSALRDICLACYQKEKTSQCPKCKLMTHSASPDTGLCPDCAVKESRRIAECADCKRMAEIVDPDLGICRRCARNRKLRDKIETHCTVCGIPTRSVVPGRTICLRCHRAELEKGRACSRCKFVKKIKNEEFCLCVKCYNDVRARRAILCCIGNFRTPYPYNRQLFELYVSCINWSVVTVATNQLVQTFARLLKHHEIPSPLTWDTVEMQPPPTFKGGQSVKKKARYCLRAVAHLLSESGELESREDYILMRRAMRLIDTAPAPIQGLLREFALWERSRQMKLHSLRSILFEVVRFWKWLFDHGVRTLEGVQQSHFDSFKADFALQWKCRCGKLEPFDLADERGPQTCSACGRKKSFEQVERYPQGSVDSDHSDLFNFFGWAVFAKKITENPVTEKRGKAAATFQIYPSKYLPPLHEYIGRLDSDPTAAILLYLLLFPCMTVWEISHIPSRDDLADGKVVDVARERRIIMPVQAASRAIVRPARPYRAWNFPGFSKPESIRLLERFQKQQEERRCGIETGYLFVMRKGNHRNSPVNGRFIHETVGQVTREIFERAGLGSVSLTPNTLRKTALAANIPKGRDYLEYLGVRPGHASELMHTTIIVIDPTRPSKPKRHSR